MGLRYSLGERRWRGASATFALFHGSRESAKFLVLRGLAETYEHLCSYDTRSLLGSFPQYIIQATLSKNGG